VIETDAQKKSSEQIRKKINAQRSFQ